MRYRDFGVAIVLTLSSSAAAMAGWNEYWHSTKTDYRRSNEWPFPFRCADQMATRQPMAAMVDNGWRRENTLGNEMFDVEKNTLSRAGAIKARWIVTQAPVHRRTVWVLRGETAEVTATRVDSVQRFLGGLDQQGPLPEVLTTDTPPAGGSGDYLDAIDRAMRSSVQPPRLPPMESDDGN
ncbi:MAG TPA: hypothetical protein VL096_05620 [Pirellulaceae bacterium]|nr:hypothetical protein [Pirellulaceae bacterium]